MEESTFSSPSAAVFSSVSTVTQVPSGSLRRDMAALSVDEKGTKTLVCNCCQNVIRVGGEEEEIRNIKARTAARDDLIAVINGMEADYLDKEDKIPSLLRAAKKAVELSNRQETREKELLITTKEALIQLFKAREAREGDKVLVRTAEEALKELTKEGDKMLVRTAKEALKELTNAW